MKRGDIVLVYIPYIDGTGGKRRPALVIQADTFNRRYPTTLVAAISTNLSQVGEPTQWFVDPATLEGQTSGLQYPSVVHCDRIFTINQASVSRILGSLPGAAMDQVDACLKATQELP
jgi:mRNA-degrading endonuclease toxin of MazEF toxin-antitoxin module